jgi:drug/metabolite transporter (DMT)-like permease
MLAGFFIILASFLWALDTLIRYPLLNTVSAERIVFTEHLYLTLIFIPFMFKHIKDVFNSKISSVFYFIMIGVFGSAIGTLTFTKAFTLINPSLVILLQKFQPLVSILLASLFLKEKIKKEFMIWALVCLIGGILISSPDIFPHLNEFNFKLVLSERSILGYILTFVAIVAWGSSTVFGKKLTQNGYNEYQIMSGRFLFGFLFMSLYWYSNPYLFSLDIKWIVWGKILAMVIIAGLFGMYFYYKGLNKISAKVCALLEMFFPLSAVVINWLYLGTKLSMIQLIGGALLILGSFIIQLKHL